jgi:hypothetical protein
MGTISCGSVGSGVLHSDRIGREHHSFNFAGPNPGDLDGFIRLLQMWSQGSATEDKSDNSHSHIFVHAREIFDPNFGAGLFEYLSP